MIPLNVHLTLCINVDELVSYFLLPILSLSSFRKYILAMDFLPHFGCFL